MHFPSDIVNHFDLFPEFLVENVQTCSNPPVTSKWLCSMATTLSYAEAGCSNAKGVKPAATAATRAVSTFHDGDRGSRTQKTWFEDCLSVLSQSNECLQKVTPASTGAG
jgi:hypothetical protein